MTGSLVVHLNRGDLYDVEPAVRSFAAEGDFDVEFHNHGRPVHVHVRPDEALARAARVESGNYYVESDAAVAVPVEVAEGLAAEGTLELVTGYGKGTAAVPVRVGPDAEPPAVEEAADAGEEAPAAAGVEARTAHVDGAAAAGTSHGDDAGSDGTAAASLRRSLAGLVGPAGALVERLPSATAAALLGLLAALVVTVVAVAAVAASGLAVVAAIFAALVGLGVAAYLLVR